MALQDILTAITEQADRKIEQARGTHQKEMTKLREESELRLATAKQQLLAQKKEKKLMMISKTKAHADARRRNALLTKKRELLDTLFGAALDQICELPQDKIEPLLRKCLKSIGAKGEIHPAATHEKLLKKIAPSEQFKIGKATEAKGGFLFTSPKQEFDFTFEHLVQEELRPNTELEVSQILFS